VNDPQHSKAILLVGRDTSLRCLGVGLGNVRDFHSPAGTRAHLAGQKNSAFFLTRAPSEPRVAAVQHGLFLTPKSFRACRATNSVSPYCWVMVGLGDVHWVTSLLIGLRQMKAPVRELSRNGNSLTTGSEELLDGARLASFLTFAASSLSASG
jgi:hypothetical protein